MAAQALSLALFFLVPAALAASPVTIVITDTLDPKQVTIEPGTTVTWRNDHAERHRMRSQSGPVEFDSGNLDPGQAYSMRFDVAGTYSYLDERNEDDPAYHGTIVVSAEATPPPTTPPPGGGGGSVTVDVVNRLYRPASITIDPGTTVIWGNIDDRPHTVTARNGSFDSGIFDTGGSYSRTFNTAGTFEYFCILHPDMIGTVTVTGSGGSPPPPPPPPEPGPAPDPQPPPPGDITIFDNGFTPASMTITPGSTVTWVNTGSLPHTATDASRRFDSGLLMSGDTYSRTFTSEGSYSYLCTIHPEMTATIVVSDGTGSAPPPPPEPGPAPPPPSDDTSSPQTGAIQIVDNAFSPTSKTVQVGSRVTWANTGSLPHTVTDRAGSFDSGLMMPGDTYTKQFSAPGTFNYLCTLHPGMTATIVVVGADGTAPPASAPVDTLSNSTGTRATGPSTVTVVDNGYRPTNISVAVGSTITWANTGALPHTVTDRSGGFDSGLLMPGDSFRRTFRETGTFDYFCTIHPEMVGTVTVTEEGTPVGTGDPSADGFVAAGGSESGPEPSTDSSGQLDPGSSVDVNVIDLDYDPREVTVASGTTVVWSNRGDIPHTVTADGLFDSGIMLTGDVFSWTFDEPGTYEYLCTLHPNMVGTVLVSSANDDAEAESPQAEAASLIPEPDPSPSTLLEVIIGIGLASIAVVMVFSLARALKLLRTD